MKFAKTFEILRGVTSDIRTPLKLEGKGMPLMVGILLDEETFMDTKSVRHWKTVFIDERLHDWDYDKQSGMLRYYSHAVRPRHLCEEEGEEVEKVDIVVIYEYF